jgi:ATP-binding protein involved in chromosome partitioning
MVKDKDIWNVLEKIRDPELGVSIVKMGMIKKVELKGDKVFIECELTTPACPLKKEIEDNIRSELSKIEGIRDVEIKTSAKVLPSRKILPEDILPGVKNIIAIGSGKGGVGKSTISANLAIALAKSGAKVGLLDGDIYGPSIPRMLGVKEPVRTDGKKLIPPEVFDIKVISIGFFITEDTPLIWRGPIISGALRQLFTDVDWGELDYLIVDLPPGTGDIPLTLAQTLPNAHGVIVTTPQPTAYSIAMKALMMFKKLNLNVIGVIENMSYFICPHCKGRVEIFGSGGGKELAEKLNVSFLGSIPLDPEVRLSCDEGIPIVISNPNSEASKAYFEVARRLAGKLSMISFKLLRS